MCFELGDPEVAEAVEDYRATLPKAHPLRDLLERGPVLDAVIGLHVKTGRQGSSAWPDVLNVMLHEFAHVIRNGFAREQVYPNLLDMDRLSKYLEERRQKLWRESSQEAWAEVQSIEDLPGARFFLDSGMSDIEMFLFPRTSKYAPYRGEPLLGHWAARTFQHDGGHDLLFYLLLYALERKAADADLYSLNCEVDRSFYVPEDVQFKGDLDGAKAQAWKRSRKSQAASGSVRAGNRAGTHRPTSRGSTSPRKTRGKSK